LLEICCLKFRAGGGGGFVLRAGRDGPVISDRAGLGHQARRPWSGERCGRRRRPSTATTGPPGRWKPPPVARAGSWGPGPCRLVGIGSARRVSTPACPSRVYPASLSGRGRVSRFTSAGPPAVMSVDAATLRLGMRRDAEVVPPACQIAGPAGQPGGTSSADGSSSALARLRRCLPQPAPQSTSESAQVLVAMQTPRPLPS
jgi:hypothetical protein